MTISEAWSGRAEGGAHMLPRPPGSAPPRCFSSGKPSIQVWPHAPLGKQTTPGWSLSPAAFELHGLKQLISLIQVSVYEL